jgi:hypothetical protein
MEVVTDPKTNLISKINALDTSVFDFIGIFNQFIDQINDESDARIAKNPNGDPEFKDYQKFLTCRNKQEAYNHLHSALRKMSENPIHPIINIEKHFFKKHTCDDTILCKLPNSTLTAAKTNNPQYDMHNTTYVSYKCSKCNMNSKKTMCVDYYSDPLIRTINSTERNIYSCDNKQERKCPAVKDCKIHACTSCGCLQCSKPGYQSHKYPHICDTWIKIDTCHSGNGHYTIGATEYYCSRCHNRTGYENTESIFNYQ